MLCCNDVAPPEPVPAHLLPSPICAHLHAASPPILPLSPVHLHSVPPMHTQSPPAPLRGLPSTMAADDIAGTKPGWRPKLLFEVPRDPMRLDLAQAGWERREQHALAAGPRSKPVVQAGCVR